MDAAQLYGALSTHFGSTHYGTVDLADVARSIAPRLPNTVAGNDVARIVTDVAGHFASGNLDVAGIAASIANGIGLPAGVASIVGAIGDVAGVASAVGSLMGGQLPTFGAMLPPGLKAFSPAAWNTFTGPLRPLCYVTIDGQPVSGEFASRLIQISISLKAGGSADTIDMELYAGPILPGQPLLSVPRKKAEIEVWLGYVETGVEYKGSYTADDVTLDCLPYKMKVQGKSASMRGGLKQHRAREWGDGTSDVDFGSVAKQIAGDEGVEIQIAPRIAQATEKWWGQQGESGLHFLQRHAERLNGAFTAKGKKLIISDRDEGESAGGSALGVLVVTPPQVVRATLTVQFKERDAHKKVRGKYRDPDTHEEQHEDVDTGDEDAEGNTTYTLRHPYANKAEAKRAATAKAQSLKREADSTSVTIVGTPYIEGGQPMIYQDIHPDVDGLEWVIDTAQLAFAKKTGFRAGIQAKSSTKGGGGKGKHKGPKIVGARPNTSMSRARGR